MKAVQEQNSVVHSTQICKAFSCGFVRLGELTTGKQPLARVRRIYQSYPCADRKSNPSLDPLPNSRTRFCGDCFQYERCSALRNDVAGSQDVYKKPDVCTVCLGNASHHSQTICYLYISEQLLTGPSQLIQTTCSSRQSSTSKSAGHSQ